MEDLKQLTDMIPAIVKAFCIAHENDSDAHLAQALVYNAGRLAWRMRETGISTTEKTNISDVVTEADKAAEMFIDKALATLRPDDGVIGEEGTNRASTSGKTWVVDPVDGTYNFATGSDYFCSALALIDADNHPIFGAVHRPAMGYTWFGGKNHPTSRDGNETTPLTPAALQTLSLGTYVHPTYLANNELREAWLKIATHVATLRMTGAASIDLASVACGDMGVWMQHSVADWDWLPGLALVEGAGGIGKKVTAGGVTWCIAGNEQAVEEITQLLGA